MKKTGKSATESLVWTIRDMGFSSAQEAIIACQKRVCQVIAAAGSGKTRTVIGLLENRIQAGVKPERILALSFSRKAVAEMRSRVGAQWRTRLEISTFHSFCYRHLRRTGLLPGKLLTPENRYHFLLDRLRSAGQSTLGIPYDVLLRFPDSFRRLLPDLCMQVHHAFYSYKRSLGAFEFDDLSRLLLLSLSHLPLREAYDLIVVDEFQDTDPLQLQFLQQMAFQQLIVVGDDWQAIYGFRGATVEPFLNFRHFFPDSVQMKLGSNYRSKKEIIEASSRIISLSKRQIRKKVSCVRGRGNKKTVVRLKISDRTALGHLFLKPAAARILVRSNYQRQLWLDAGCHPEVVSTIHKVKGLEFPLVLLDLSGGWNRQPERPDEEIRIAYVGASRAEDRLILLSVDIASEDTTEGRILKLFENQLQISIGELKAWLEEESGRGE